MNYVINHVLHVNMVEMEIKIIVHYVILILDWNQIKILKIVYLYALIIIIIIHLININVLLLNNVLMIILFL